MNASQPRSSTRCSAGGCGFPMICLMTMDYITQAARFCRRSERTFLFLYLKRGSARVIQPWVAKCADTSRLWWRNVSG
jgi:hypothetical protein